MHEAQYGDAMKSKKKSIVEESFGCLNRYFKGNISVEEFEEIVFR